MQVDLQQCTGVNMLSRKREQVKSGFDRIMFEGRELGISVHYESAIHWRFDKNKIPAAIKNACIRAVQERNADVLLSRQQ